MRASGCVVMKSASTVVAAASIPSCRTPRRTVPDRDQGDRPAERHDPFPAPSEAILQVDRRVRRPDLGRLLAFLAHPDTSGDIVVLRHLGWPELTQATPTLKSIIGRARRCVPRRRWTVGTLSQRERRDQARADLHVVTSRGNTPGNTLACSDRCPASGCGCGPRLAAHSICPKSQFTSAQNPLPTNSPFFSAAGGTAQAAAAALITGNENGTSYFNRGTARLPTIPTSRVKARTR